MPGVWEGSRGGDSGASGVTIVIVRSSMQAFLVHLVLSCASAHPPPSSQTTHKETDQFTDPCFRQIPRLSVTRISGPI